MEDTRNIRTYSSQTGKYSMSLCSIEGGQSISLGINVEHIRTTETPSADSNLSQICSRRVTLNLDHHMMVNVYLGRGIVGLVRLRRTDGKGGKNPLVKPFRSTKCEISSSFKQRDPSARGVRSISQTGKVRPGRAGQRSELRPNRTQGSFVERRGHSYVERRVFEGDVQQHLNVDRCAQVSV